MRSRATCLLLCTLLLAGCQAASSALPAKTAQELLAEQPIDDTHDAFLVDTGGQLGTLLVTPELGTEREGREVSMRLSVWNPADMSQPIQTQDWTTVSFGVHEIVDVNFDGYSDFTYLYTQGVQVGVYHCMVWDEEQGLFTEVPAYFQIPSPHLDAETETISGWSRSSGAGDGWTPIYRWIGGELVCVRQIETFLKERSDPNTPFVLTVEDRVDGQLTEVYRAEFPTGSSAYLTEQLKWEDLDYHGAPTEHETRKEKSP